MAMAPLQIELPTACAREAAYIVDVLFGDFLGVPFVRRHIDRPDIRISREGPRELVLDASFFHAAEAAWLGPATLPRGPLVQFEGLPVLFADPSRAAIARGPEGLTLGLDLLGSSFFMLARYEEAVLPDRDVHGRFPARAALAYREGFLDRPVVNEYLELLWRCLQELWPDLARRERAFRTLPSHDMDAPYRYLFLPPWRFVDHSLRDLVKGRLRDLTERLTLGTRVKLGQLAADPFNTVAFLLDESDRRGLTSAFYFFGDRPDPAYDCLYEIEDPRILALIDQIYGRGHEVGLHPSYTTYLDPDRTTTEFLRLRRACAGRGVEQARWGGRQHFLRWSTPQTMRNWVAAGLDYDSTLGFADAAGFRAGTCYEYPLYDVQAREALTLRERPLIAMECSVIDAVYMGLGTGDAALACLTQLKNQCRRYQGDFTLLWHNSRLYDPAERALYLATLDA
ncbi:MAG: hypothetical protein JWM80_3873 [Cyanobacteria bacterium RYN_339]|nr:hypothetical protein [Cyanobacteria bacterium RYN_339]